MLKKHFVGTLLALFGLAFVTQATVMHALVSTGHAWDAGAIHTIAKYYVENGTTEIPGSWEEGYLAHYENNIPITLVLTLAYKTAKAVGIESYALAGPAINFVAVFGSFVILVLVAWKLYGKKAALMAYGLGFALIILSAYVPITYTDTLGMFAVMLSLGAAVMCYYSDKRARIAWAGVFGATIVAAYLMKPTAVILPFMLVVVYLAKSRLVVDWKIALYFIAGLVLSYGTYTVVRHSLPNFADYSAEYLDAKRTPAEHFLGMGSLRGLPPFEYCKRGVYCADYVDWEWGATGGKGLPTLAERKEFGLQLWKDSVTTDFPFAYTRFIIGKAIYSYGDGSFGTWQEGAGNNANLKFRYNTSPDRAIRSLMGPLGSRLKAYKKTLKAIWFAMLGVIASGIGLALVSKRFRNSSWQNSFRLTVLALTGYLMLFETRPRYLFLYVPVFILLAVGTMQHWLQWRQDRLRSR